MKKALSSEIADVRSVAHLELWLFRGASIVGALLCAFCTVRWQSLLGSRIVRAISAHSVDESGCESGAATRFGKTWPVIIASVGLALLYVVLASSVFSDRQLHVINHEGGIIESATAIFFSLCCVGSVITALAFKKKKASAYAFMHGLLALCFFLFVGEEISWGQRLFQVETLDFFEKHNVQGENNLHNLFGYMADHVFILAVFVYGFVMPVLQRYSLFVRKLFSIMGLPIPSAGLAIGFLLVSLLHDWSVYRVVTPVPGLKIPELREFLCSIAFGLLVYESWSAVRTRGTA